MKWTKEVKKEYKKIQKEKKRKRDTTPEPETSKATEMHDVDEFKMREVTKKVSKASFATRVAKEAEKPQVKIISGLGNRQMVFSTEKRDSKGHLKRQEEMKKHREERKQVIRPTTNLKKR